MSDPLRLLLMWLVVFLSSALSGLVVLFLIVDFILTLVAYERTFLLGSCLEVGLDHSAARCWCLV